MCGMSIHLGWTFGLPLRHWGSASTRKQTTTTTWRGTTGKTCDKDYPLYLKCSDLPPEYRYGSTYQALAALGGGRLGKAEPARKGPCSVDKPKMAGKHWNVKSIDKGNTIIRSWVVGLEFPAARNSFPYVLPSSAACRVGVARSRTSAQLFRDRQCATKRKLDGLT